MSMTAFTYQDEDIHAYKMRVRETQLSNSHLEAIAFVMNNNVDKL